MSTSRSRSLSSSCNLYHSVMVLLLSYILITSVHIMLNNKYDATTKECLTVILSISRDTESIKSVLLTSHHIISMDSRNFFSEL